MLIFWRWVKNMPLRITTVVGDYVDHTAEVLHNTSLMFLTAVFAISCSHKCWGLQSLSENVKPCRTTCFYCTTYIWLVVTQCGYVCSIVRLSQAVDCSFIYWHRVILPMYLNDLRENTAEAFRLRVSISVQGKTQMEHDIRTYFWILYDMFISLHHTEVFYLFQYQIDTIVYLRGFPSLSDSALQSVSL